MLLWHSGAKLCPGQGGGGNFSNFGQVLLISKRTLVMELEVEVGFRLGRGGGGAQKTTPHAKRTEKYQVGERVKQSCGSNFS